MRNNKMNILNTVHKYLLYMVTILENYILAKIVEELITHLVSERTLYASTAQAIVDEGKKISDFLA
jgi:transposase